MLRVLYWMLVTLLWIDVFMTGLTYGDESLHGNFQGILTGALTLTSIMVISSTRFRSWMK